MLAAAMAQGSDIDALRTLDASSGSDAIAYEVMDSNAGEWCAFAFDPAFIDAGALGGPGVQGDPDTNAARSGTSTADATRVVAASGGSRRFGAAGSWRWQILGGGGIGTDSISNGQVGAGVSWFVVDDLSIDVQVNADYFNQSGPSAWGGDVELLFRWHFLARDTWSIYVDGGCGLMWTSHDVPPDSASFNFTPQAGAGMTWEIATDTRLMLGARWFHVSNANTASPNPSYNGVFAYAGVSFGF
jgi:hypothetical protein